MPQPSKSGADFSLTINSVEYPFFLAKGENGAKQWNDGLAPMFTPQVRTTGFGYEHIPPDIEVIENFDSFEGGAGYVNAKGSSVKYNYSQHVDLSWEDYAFVALAQRSILESDGSEIAAAPVKFYYSSNGLFMLAGQYIYEWDLSTTAWVQRNDATADAVNYKDFTSLDGTDYASRGTGADYKYSTDGVTWTAFTDADENADVWAVRGNGSDVAAVWKVLTNVIKTTTNGANGGVAWTGSDEVGHTGETVQSAVTVDNTIYIFKKEGIYSYDGTNTQDVWKTQYIQANNGKGAYLHSSGNIYTPYGGRLLEYDPYGTTPITSIYPPANADSLEVRGDITAISGNETHLYIAVKNRAGNTYIMKGDTHNGVWVWHTIQYLGANDCNAIYVAGPGILHATNPAYVYGYGTSTKYTVLPRENIKPSDDPLCSFTTTEGVVYGSYVDFGATTIHKFLNRGLLYGTNLSASRFATLKYEYDNTGIETTLVSAASGHMAENANESSEVEFCEIRAILAMGTSDYSSTPVLLSYALGATLNPARKRMWQPVIVVSDHDEFRGGTNTESMPSSDAIRRVLFGAVTKRVTLTDRANIDYIVRLLDIQPAPLMERDIGGEERDFLLYRLTMVEIATLTSDATGGVYDSSAYDSGHVYTSDVMND